VETLRIFRPAGLTNGEFPAPKWVFGFPKGGPENGARMQVLNYLGKCVSLKNNLLRMHLSHLRLYLLLPVLFLMIGGSGRAQCFAETNFLRYTRLQGLSNNYISGVEEDSTGYIWVATHKGLNRFDGKTFQPIYKGSIHSPLPDNLVVAMRHQRGNEIMGATRAGAFAYNPVNGNYKQFIIPCDTNIFFWANHTLDILKDKKGNYVISTKTGLYIYDSTGSLTRRYDHHIPSDVGSQEMIFGGWLSPLADGRTLQQNGLLGSIYDPVLNRIDTLYVARRENLKKQITDDMGNMRPAWAGRNEELFLLDREKNSIDVADMRSTQGSSNLMPFVVSSDLGWTSTLSYINDTLLAMTCINSGFYVLHYDPRTKKISCDGQKFFKGSLCTVVFRDREDRLWIGTADGLYKENLQNSIFSVMDLSTQASYPADHEIRCIYADDAFLYTGLQSGGGVLVLDKSTGTIKKRIQFTPQFAYSSTIHNIYPYSEDTLWVGTGNGIVWLNKKNDHYGRLNIPPQLKWMQETNTRCFFQDSKGNIWISFGELNSLVRYNRATRTFSDMSPPYNPWLKITFVFSMAEDLEGNIWLAGDGLCRWNIKKQLVDTLIPYPRVSKLIRNYMYILGRDPKNNLWLSSYDNEIIQYNCTTNTMILRREENNLVDGNTVTSSPIINKNIWMGTDNGISAFNINDYSIKQFTYADGLPSVAITSYRRGSFYDQAANRFYIAARHRLISFTPDVTQSHKIAPTLFIEKILVRDSLIVPNGKDIRLAYNQNNMSIHFNTVNFNDPEENRFAWRMMHGSDTAWEELNTQNLITLTSLPGGWHPIQIKLFSANNHWPEQVRSLNIYIRPPFWKTIWFILLLAAGVAGIIILIYKTRVNAVRSKERQNAQVQQLIAEEYKNRLELEQIINYFSSSLTDKSKVEDVLWDVMQNLISRLGYADCIIYLWNEQRTKMVQKAAYGPKGTPAALASAAFDVYPGQGLVGYVMRTSEPVLIADTRKDKRYRVDDVARLSEITVPILHNDELLGIIDSEHPNPDYFKERDLKILTTIATLVGNKIKQIESEQSLEIHQKEIAYVNQQLAEAQLSALQTQMNPHFIFNCLNSIKGMILNDERQKASRYLSKFANMIRTTLNQSKEIFTTLYENIEHLENYLVMEKLRFDDSFCFNVIVDEDIDKEEILIPTLMIQPLAENAIWHGLMYKTGDKELTIQFSRLDGTISCSIEDNGIGIHRSEQLRKLSKSSHKSVGLNNLRNRIKIMNEKYDTGCTLQINDMQEIDNSRSGTRVVLRFKIITNKLFI
jgi:ligand-binding sensor domain-containing protein/putative methionine-R-sulfoxide reductase with GAF domain